MMTPYIYETRPRHLGQILNNPIFSSARASYSENFRACMEALRREPDEFLAWKLVQVADVMDYCIFTGDCPLTDEPQEKANEICVQCILRHVRKRNE